MYHPLLLIYGGTTSVAVTRFDAGANNERAASPLSTESWSSSPPGLEGQGQGQGERGTGKEALEQRRNKTVRSFVAEGDTKGSVARPTPMPPKGERR